MPSVIVEASQQPLMARPPRLRDDSLQLINLSFGTSECPELEEVSAKLIIHGTCISNDLMDFFFFFGKTSPQQVHHTRKGLWSFPHADEGEKPTLFFANFLALLSLLFLRSSITRLSYGARPATSLTISRTKAVRLAR